MDRNNDLSAAMRPSHYDDVLELFGSICDRAAEVLADNQDWGDSGLRTGQYAVDLDVDDVCVQPLLAAGFAVLSEESGMQQQPEPTNSVVVVDPLDGSTNASLGLPWCATALCLVVDEVPTVAMVSNLATGDRYEAILDHGAQRGGEPLLVAPPTPLDDAIVAMNGLPPAHWGWRQFRAMGAAALDITAVARGGFDAFVDTTIDSHGVWDYLAAVLILEEAGGVAVDASGRDLTLIEHGARRTPIAASSHALLDELLAARNS